MKKHLPFAAFCASAMLLLNGCAGKGINYAREYRDYFDYTFDRGYSFDFTEMTDNDGRSARHSVYRLEYTDGYGEQRVNEEVDCYPYPKDKNELYPTKQIYYDAMLEEIIFNEMNDIGSEHFFEEYAVPYFGAAEKEDILSYPIDDHASAIIVFMTPIYLPESNEKAAKIAYSYISPETGWKVSETTLESIMCDANWSLIFSVRLDADADKDAYIAKMREMEAAFCEKMETPQNYQFLVRQRKSTDEDNYAESTVYYSGLLMGEAFDPQNSEENYSKTLYARLLEKYGNS